LVEYMEGGSLEQLIQATISADDVLMTSADRDVTPLPWSTRVSIASDVAKGIAYLHSEGIFHRDLTSKNVLIRRKSNRGGPMTSSNQDDVTIHALVADFGLAAKIPKCSAERLSQVGSPYWMSPECLRGDFYDEKSDVFSYGIVLCELIAGVRADPDELPRTPNFGVDYLAFSALLVNSDCPPQFLQLAFSCVTIEPNSRPDFDALCDSLKEISESLLQRKQNSIVDVSNGTTASAEPKIAAKNADEQQQSTKETMKQQLPKTTAAAVTAADDTTAAVVKKKRVVRRSRRSQTQQQFPHFPPSEVARHHNNSSSCQLSQLQQQQRTPEAVGHSASILDPHYVPSDPNNKNPFAQLPRHLTAARKVFSSDADHLFSSCFELMNLNSSAGTGNGSGWVAVHGARGAGVASIPYRKTVSMVQPTELVKNLQ